MPLDHLALVDDDDALRALAGICLRQIPGTRVSCSASGAEALELARRDPPDLLLLDVQMPGMDGFEVLAQWRADGRTAGIPVVLLTASTPDTLDPSSLERLGVIGVIGKPFDPRALAATARRLWSSWASTSPKES